MFAVSGWVNPAIMDGAGDGEVVGQSLRPAGDLDEEARLDEEKIMLCHRRSRRGRINFEIGEALPAMERRRAALSSLDRAATLGLRRLGPEMKSTP
jgi:hypothetical protein